MARNGRPPSTTPRLSIKVQLLPQHHELLEILDKDPFKDKRVYGARNFHFDKALAEYFAKYYPEYLPKSVDSGQ
jgi:hypothetical protein